MIDDPQDDESANSPSQCERRERIVSATVLGLAGPGKKIAAVMPCTVIRDGDLAHRMLDRKTHPDWYGERTKMVYAFPKNEARWTEYAEIRQRCQREDRPVDEANDYYAANREEMDAGPIVAWPERYNVDELSAIQHAMNLKLRDEMAFLAEYQQAPLTAAGEEEKPKLSTIADRVNRLPKGVLPRWASRLVAFIDVQAKALWYKVAAFADDFTGAFVDYGTEPEQSRDYFTLRDLKRTLQAALEGSGKTGGLEAALWFGLDQLTGKILCRPWRREDGADMRVDRCLVDSGWGDSTETVYEFCRRSPHAAVLMPSKGVGIRAGDRPMTEWPLKPHECPGFNFVLTSDPAKRAVRLLKYDTNFFKTLKKKPSAIPASMIAGRAR